MRTTPPSLNDLLAIHLPGPRETARDPHLKAEREFSDTVIARVENAAQAAAYLDYRYDTKSRDPARWERQFQRILETYATPDGIDLPPVASIKLCPVPDGHNQPEPFVDKIERLRGVRLDPPQETRDWSHDTGNRVIPGQRREHHRLWGRLFGRFRTRRLRVSRSRLTSPSARAPKRSVETCQRSSPRPERHLPRPPAAISAFTNAVTSAADSSVNCPEFWRDNLP